MADFALAHPRELSFLELHHHGSYLDEQSLAIEHGIIEFGVVMVRRAQEAQAIKKADPLLLMELVNGAFLGVFRASVEGRLKLTKDDVHGRRAVLLGGDSRMSGQCPTALFLA